MSARSGSALGPRARGLIGVAALLCGAGPAHAFDVIDRYWSASDFPLRYALDTDGFDPGAGATADAIAAAFDAWAGVDCAPGVTFATGAWSGADIRLLLATRDADWSPPPDSGVLAYASTWGDQSTITFNGLDVTWTTDGEEGDGEADLQGVATHEIGHSLGLDHSRDLEATMFFSGSNVRLRSLEPDDERGICWLYGSKQPGEICDFCTGDDECGGELDLCLGFGDAGAFCGKHCARASDCPPTTFCGELTSGDKSCVPENLVCDESPGDFPLGAFCHGNVNCASDLCLVVEDDAYCSRECDPDAGTACSGGLVCLPTVDGGGACYRGGDAALGEPCETHGDCTSLVCIDDGEGGGLCTEECDPADDDCPSGFACLGEDGEGVCIASGEGAFGDACESNMECESFACVGLSDDDYRCSLPCEDDGDCPDGSPCWDWPGDDYCAPAEGCDPWTGAGCDGGEVCWLATAEDGLCVEPAGEDGEGETCTVSGSSCENELVCAKIPGDSAPRCWDPCNVETGEGCPGGRHCLEQESLVSPIGVCPPTTGSGGLGAACRNYNSCASAWCVDDDGASDDDDDGSSDDDDECACDETYDCDEGCDHCDPECPAEDEGGGLCRSLPAADAAAGLWVLMTGLALLQRRRDRSPR